MRPLTRLDSLLFVSQRIFMSPARDKVIWVESDDAIMKQPLIFYFSTSPQTRSSSKLLIDGWAVTRLLHSPITKIKTRWEIHVLKVCFWWWCLPPREPWDLFFLARPYLHDGRQRHHHPHQKQYVLRYTIATTIHVGSWRVWNDPCWIRLHLLYFN